MGAAADKAGIPAVSIVATEFLQLVKAAAQGQGLSSMAAAVFPHEVMLGIVENVGPDCEKVVEEIIYGLTKWKPDKADAHKRELIFEGVNYQDAITKMESTFLSQMSSDGLPLVPPTEELVEWMLTGTDLPRDKELTTKFGPRFGSITVENVAINAVMAGARPEYLPVILATVDLLATDKGLGLMSFLSESGAIFGPVLLINGPIAKELNINSSFGVMGPGWKANATIGRAISLLLINGAGGHSGPGGTQRGQSLPGRYTWCFAENEPETPWTPLHVELGYETNVSTVTVLAGRGTQNIKIKVGAKELLASIACALRGITVMRYAIPWEQLLVLVPEHAQLLADAGWSKETIRDFIYEEARVSIAEAETAGWLVQYGDWVKRLANVTDKNTLVPMTDKADDLVIVVAGGTGSGTSTLIPAMGRMVTGVIDKYKPRNWQQLIKTADKELLY